MLNNENNKRRWATHRITLWCSVVAMLAPFVMAIIAFWGKQWYPTGDFAQAELHMRGFFAHPPLVGAAGRIGTLAEQGSHPGPSMWVALLPVYVLLGRSAIALAISGLVFNAAVALGCVWTAKRTGGDVWAVIVSVGTAVLVLANGPSVMSEPWNPWLAVLPFFWCLLLCHQALTSAPRAIAGAAIVGTHCIQCHVGYLILVAGVVGATMAVLMVRAWRERSARREVLSWSLVGILAMAVMWIPPVLDQIRREPGNLEILYRHFTHPPSDQSFLGLGGAIHALAVEYNLWGNWLRGAVSDPSGPIDVVGCIAFCLVVVGTLVYAVRVRSTFALWLHGIAMTGTVVGVASMSRIFGGLFPYTIRWIWTLALVHMLAAIASLIRPTADKMREFGARFAVASVALSLLVSLHACWSFARAPIPAQQDSQMVAGLTAKVIPHLNHQRYLIRWYDPVALGGGPYGVMLELERQGFTVGVDPAGSAAALPHRVMPEDSADSVLWVVLGDETIGHWRNRPDLVELGYFDYRNTDQRARSIELRHEIREELVATGHPEDLKLLDANYGAGQLLFRPGIDPHVFDLVAEYVGLRLPAAVFEVPVHSSFDPSAPDAGSGS